MNSAPTVIVKKGGFLTAIVKGIFGTLMVVMLCATALGLYGLRIADHFVQSQTTWQTALPPIFADALNDHRAIDYRDALKITTRFEPTPGSSDTGNVLLAVTNTGKDVVSLLDMRLVVDDASGDPPCELPIKVAASRMFNDSGRGPLQPGETHYIGRHIRDVSGDPKVLCEITDLRLWNGPVARVPAEAPPAATPPAVTAPPAPPAPAVANAHPTVTQ